MADFTLLSLNTFGLPLFLGWSRLARLTGQLTRYAPAVICLQEIQQNAYVPLLARRLPDYPHRAYELGLFAPRGGLYTAARGPLVHSHFVAYSNRGKPFSPGFADWALNKGVLVSEFDVREHRVIVMNTHLHANYAGNWDPEHSMTRIQRDQVDHLADMVREQPPEAIVIVCGDFNFPRNTFLYTELLERGGLTDPLADDPRPTYRPFPLIPAQKWSIPIDFMLVRIPPHTSPRVVPNVMTVEDESKSLPHRRFLTDHNALTLELHWDNDAGAANQPEQVKPDGN